MIDQHPITPPPNELVDEWKDKHEGHMPEWIWRHVAADAARWGADQELEACIEWLDRRLFDRGELNSLRSSRRPKPPSLKEQALEAFEELIHGVNNVDVAIIRRALEALPND